MNSISSDETFRLMKVFVDATGSAGPMNNCSKYGNGHINDTYLVVCDKADGTQVKYILQCVHCTIFSKAVPFPSRLPANCSKKSFSMVTSAPDILPASLCVRAMLSALAPL